MCTVWLLNQQNLQILIWQASDMVILAYQTTNQPILYGNLKKFPIFRSSGVNSYSISGSTAFCSGTQQTFQLVNVPAGSTVSWTSSNNIQIITDPSSYVVTAQGTSDGTGFVSAYVVDLCYNKIPINFPLTVGSGARGTYVTGAGIGGNTYNVQPTNSITLSGTNNTAFITMYAAQPNTTFSWRITYQSTSGTSMQTYYNNGSLPSPNSQAQLQCYPGKQLNVTCTVTNNCATQTFSFNCYNYTSSYSVVAYPNPAQQQLNVITKSSTASLSSTKADISSDESVNNEDTYEIQARVKLSDKNGQVVREGDLKNGRLTLSISSLINGTYYLKVDDGKKVTNSQIIIQH
jgi:hypothetical protein